jgi:ABC-type multidrug transport system ATPase subunit
MKLTINQLNKTYENGVKALDNVSLEINAGMFGLLGPNGAGKSTLMRTLATLQDADSGSAFLDEIDVLNQKDEVRKTLGYLPQEFGVYPKISALELLDHLAVLKGFSDKKERKQLVDFLLDKVNLFEHRKKAVSSYSGGMRQRFGIAQCLIGNPKLIIVDEPTAGLDPGERNRFYNLLSEIGENTIVILSTHIVEDVYELCSSMAVIDRGKVLYAGAPADGLHSLKDKIWELQIEKNQLENYQQNHQIISNKLVGGKPMIHVFANQKPDDHFKAAEPNLEDFFFIQIKGIQ